MTRLVALLAPALLATTALLAAPAQAAGPTYVASSTTVLPSTDTGWDYVALQPGTSRLFMARRADGLTVFDVNTRQVVGTVENSIGANGPVLLPEFNRGYVAMTDGTMLVFDLTTLKAIDRPRLDEGDLNQGFYDPATKRVHMVVGNRPQRTTWITLDAATGQVLGRTQFDSRKMDDPAPDGRGAIYAPMRDTNRLLKLRSSDLAVEADWSLGDCVQPVTVEYDHAAARVLIGCRGPKPVFIALDPADGRITATLPIGRGIDGMVHDEIDHLLVTANGVDATMTVIRQDGPDSYTPVETIATVPMARVLVLDPATRRLFTVTAGHSLPAPGPDGKPRPVAFHPDSFTVLGYVRR